MRPALRDWLRGAVSGVGQPTTFRGIRAPGVALPGECRLAVGNFGSDGFSET